MTLDDLRRLAAMGEGRYLEFKNRVPRPDRLAREIIALANTDGGKVLIGVDDDGSVVGVKDADEELFALREALGGRVEPEVEIEVEPVRVSRRRLALVVDVPPSMDRPHYLRPDADPRQKRKVFVRVEDQSVEASREAVLLMKEQRKGTGARFTFGERERKLLAYLDRHERVTVEGYARLAGVPPWKASKTLVQLAHAGVLALHAQPGGADYFTASVA
ncbi:AlbA family DNA-binding domain-containing protein [Rubricoccus marinus]|uniref:Schlafen AlbA-2 domain-containing protein n=1 Tax=Rubricoccus marinus TaxID=716817 RepID=A0A259U0N3_9BACT|nr:ATP-binding protein [Rubricoccus marinus]OZC03384.1 hypothetical protein BSZ36_10570 [Rubricoccus marinus]